LRIAISATNEQMRIRIAYTIASPSLGCADKLLVSILIPHRRKPIKTAKSKITLVYFLLMKMNLYIGLGGFGGYDKQYGPCNSLAYYSTPALSMLLFIDRLAGKKMAFTLARIL
jgi:hypothetical protein